MFLSDMNKLHLSSRSGDVKQKLGPCIDLSNVTAFRVRG